jgi:hypothetical protein
MNTMNTSLLGPSAIRCGRANPNGIESFSPALADEIGLRRVIGKHKNQP